MPWFLIAEGALKLFGFVFTAFKGKDEGRKWLAMTAEKLRKKGWVRQEFVLNLSKDQIQDIEEQIEKYEEENNAPTNE